MRRFIAVATLGMILTGCDLPRDPESTESLVRARHVIHLGWVSGAEPDTAAEATLAELSRRLGARIVRREEESEVLLNALEKGELDLVYGHFAEDSPWSRKVHFGKAEGREVKPARHAQVPRFLMRNGENGWIMTVAGAGAGAGE